MTRQPPARRFLAKAPPMMPRPTTPTASFFATLASARRRSHALYIHRHRPQRLGFTLDDHVFGGRLVFLEMLGRRMRLDSRGVIVDLEEENVIRILLRDGNIQLAATRLLHRRRTVLLERGKE